MPPFSNSSALIIQLSPELKRKLRDVSWQTQTPMSALVREAIVRLLDQRDRQAT